MISIRRIRAGAAALAIALFVAGCSGSSDNSASTGAKQAAPPAPATQQPLSNGREVSAAAVRKLLAKEKAKALRHAANQKAPSSAAGSLAQVAKKGLARQIIRQLAAARRGHSSPVGRRLKKVIGGLLAHRKGKGGFSGASSSGGPSSAGQVVQEIINRAEEAK